MPEEAWKGRRVFGCVSYVMMPNVKKSKLNARARNVYFWVIVRELRPIG